jgi:hypothetical protein
MNLNENRWFSIMSSYLILLENATANYQFFVENLKSKPHDVFASSPKKILAKLALYLFTDKYKK